MALFLQVLGDEDAQWTGAKENAAEEEGEFALQRITDQTCHKRLQSDIPRLAQIPEARPVALKIFRTREFAHELFNMTCYILFKRIHLPISSNAF